jgi:hypothetical protein
LAERALELNAFTHFKLQKACYKSLRTLFGLSAQAACLVCAKVADAYAISKTPRQFRPDGAIIYDLRLLSWNVPESLVSIWALPKRLSIPFVCGEKQRELLSYPRGQSDLIYRNGTFYLHVTVDLPDTEEQAVMDLIGVDLGVANIAFDSDGNRYSGAHINKVRHRSKSLRKKLQKKATKSAKRLIRRRGKKERRFATDTNHVISKRIVTLAERTGRGIAIEELDGIRGRARAKKDQRYWLHSWVSSSPIRPSGRACPWSLSTPSTPASGAAGAATPNGATDGRKPGLNAVRVVTRFTRMKMGHGTSA